MEMRPTHRHHRQAVRRLLDWLADEVCPADVPGPTPEAQARITALLAAHGVPTPNPKDTDR